MVDPFLPTASALLLRSIGHPLKALTVVAWSAHASLVNAVQYFSECVDVTLESLSRHTMVFAATVGRRNSFRIGPVTGSIGM